MSYRHYQTECFVVNLSDSREANRTVFLLTRELGPLRAQAQGLRRMQSKLRYALQPPARAKVTLVHGRDNWRIVGAEEGEHYWLNFKDKREHLSLISRLFSFLERILVGEEVNQRLFSIVDGAVNFVSAAKRAGRRTLFAAELIAVARLLSALGYFNYPAAAEILERASIISADIDFVHGEKEKFLAAVNASLKETHL